MTSITPAGISRRDDRIDFLRGIALLIIFIDHVPKNLFEPFTLHAFAFCDAAEIFFFISGYVAALVYGRVMVKKGFVPAAKKVWRRAGVVYGAQFFLLACVLALVAVFLRVDDNFRWIFRIQWVFENPLAYVLPALTLHYQPGYLDILPAYVVLLALFPLVLAGLNRNFWYVLVPSFALWLIVQLFGLTLWTTSGERWFFNPFAWQFIFVLGALFGHPALEGRLAFRDNPWLLRGAVVLTAVIAVIQLSATLNTFLWWVPSLRPDAFPIDKTALQPMRLISFFALALVVRHYLPARGTLSRLTLAMPIIRCGRHSLNVFCFGVLLSSFTVVSLVLSRDNVLVQSLVCIAGVGAQLAYAAWRDAKRDSAPLLSPPMGEPVPVRSKARRSNR